MLLFNVLPFIGVYIDFHIFNFEHQVKGKIEKLKLKKKTGTCGTCGGTCTCVATCVQHVINMYMYSHVMYSTTCMYMYYTYGTLYM